MANQSTAVGFDGRRLVALRHDVRALFSSDPGDRTRLKRQMLEDGAPLSWVECAYESAWKGHPSGEFAFTPENLRDIKRLFDDGEQPLPFLYGHPRHDMGLPIDAAGWIQALEVRPGDGAQELWALVEWTADAADRIKTGKQRFCSVVVDFDPVDRATGESAGLGELFEIGLVGSPFLPGMTPITLSRVGAPARTQQRTLAMATPIDPTKMVEGVAKSLGLKKDATLEEIKALLDAVFAFVGAMPGSAKGAPPDFAAAAAELSRVIKLEDFPMPEAEEATETAASMVLTKLVTATGLDEAAVVAGVEANLDAIAALITGVAASGGADAAALAVSKEVNPEGASLSRIADQSRITELSARANEQAKKIAALEADLAKRTAAETEARIAASFSRLVVAGKAGESQRGAFLKLSALSEDIAVETYESYPAVLPPKGAVATGTNAAPPKAAAVKASRSDDSPEALTEIAFRRVAKERGLVGAAADIHVATMLARHQQTNPGA